MTNIDQNKSASLKATLVRNCAYIHCRTTILVQLKVKRTWFKQSCKLCDRRRSLWFAIAFSLQRCKTNIKRFTEPDSESRGPKMLRAKYAKYLNDGQSMQNYFLSSPSKEAGQWLTSWQKNSIWNFAGLPCRLVSKNESPHSAHILKLI